MTIRVISTCFNEVSLLPFYLRHYKSFADEIVIYDHDSYDGSRSLIAGCNKAQLKEWPFGPGMDDDGMMKLWNMALKEAKEDGIDWVIVPDIDEFIWCDKIRSELEKEDSNFTKVITAEGWNMVGDGIPEDRGRQIWQDNYMGVQEHIYSKPIIVKPDMDYEWVPGRHNFVEVGKGLFLNRKFKLLHYRFLGASYTQSRTGKNYSRIALHRNEGWWGAMAMEGFGTPGYAESIKEKAINVFST